MTVRNKSRLIKQHKETQSDCISHKFKKYQSSLLETNLLQLKITVHLTVFQDLTRIGEGNFLFQTKQLSYSSFVMLSVKGIVSQYKHTHSTQSPSPPSMAGSPVKEYSRFCMTAGYIILSRIIIWSWFLPNFVKKFYHTNYCLTLIDKLNFALFLPYVWKVMAATAKASKT